MTLGFIRAGVPSLMGIKIEKNEGLFFFPKKKTNLSGNIVFGEQVNIFVILPIDMIDCEIMKLIQHSLYLETPLNQEK